MHSRATHSESECYPRVCEALTVLRSTVTVTYGLSPRVRGIM